MVRPPTELLGEWGLARQVRDEVAGLSGSASGELTLHLFGDEIAWHEQGTLLWNGSQLSFSRDYRFRRSGEQWWLHFSDGRPFHLWQPGHWVEHPCRTDVYRGLITLPGADAWQTQWDLQGPAKAQRITTQFSRRPVMSINPSDRLSLHRRGTCDPR